MILYRALYSRGSAAAIVIASWLILATAQMAVVADAMAALHPGWPVWLRTLAAVGYELATLAVGLVIAVRAGEGRAQSVVLWGGLALFVAVSSFFGFDAAMRGLIGEDYRAQDLASADAVQWIRAVLGGAVLPVQYLLAVAAGHQLAAHASTREPAREATQTDAPDSKPAPEPRRSGAPHRPRVTAKRAAVLDAAAAHPDASRRELARQAGVGDGVVRRMEAAGMISRNGSAGWQIDPANE